jgi:hypothetical protein
MKLIFEIRDLKFATPATATRAGILYISEGNQWHNMVTSWIARVVSERPVCNVLQHLWSLQCPKHLLKLKSITVQL